MTQDLRAEFPNLTFVDREITPNDNALIAVLEDRLAHLRAKNFDSPRWITAFPQGPRAGLSQVWTRPSLEEISMRAELPSHQRLSYGYNLCWYSQLLAGERERQLVARFLIDSDAQGGASAQDPGPGLAVMSTVNAAFIPWPSARLVTLAATMCWNRWVLQNPSLAFEQHLDAFVERYADLTEADLQRFAGDPSQPDVPSHANGFTNENIVMGYTLDDILTWQGGAPVDDALRARPSYQRLAHVWNTALSRSALLTTAYALALAVEHVVDGREDLCDFRGHNGFKGIAFQRHVAEMREARKAAQAAAQARAAVPEPAKALPWLDASGQPLRTVLHQTVPAADHALTLDFGASDSDPDAAFADQANGLLGLQVPGLISLVIGAQHAQVALTVHLCGTEPPLPSPGWTELVEGDWSLPPAHGDTDNAVEGLVFDIDGIDHGSLQLPPGPYRVRLGVAGFDREGEGGNGADPTERFTLALWPLAPQMPARCDAVLRVHSASARNWHAQRLGPG